MLTVSETWLNKNTEDRLASIENYQLIRYDREVETKAGSTKRGGGVCIYTKNYIEIDPITHKNLNASNKNIEMQWVILNRPNTKKILLVNVYRPPDGNVEEAFDAISEGLDTIDKLNKYEILIMGDFNTNYSSKQNQQLQHILKFETYQQLKQMITKATRYSDKAQTTIDLAFTNIKYCKGAGVINYNISDHKLIYIIKKKPRNCKETITKMGRSYANCTNEQLELEIRSHDTTNLMNEENPDKCWALIKQIIANTTDKLCPIKEQKIRIHTAKYLNRQLLDL